MARTLRNFVNGEYVESDGPGTDLVNPATGWLEAGLIIVYSLLPGLVLGYLLIRVDLLFTGPRGRRARGEEEATAIRPEPARLQPLL